MSTDQRSVEVLRCPACGDAVAFVDAEETACEGCETSVEIPPAFRERARELAGAQEGRDMALATLQSMPQPLPPWVVRTMSAVLQIGLPFWVAVAVVGWVFWGWFPTPLHMLGWGIFTPVFILIFALVDSLSAAGYTKGRLALGAVPGSSGWSCRACGSAFQFPDGDLVATCRYCGADNLLLHDSARWQSWIEAARREADSQLAGAVTDLDRARKGRKTTRIVLAAVLLPLWLLFCWPLVWIMFASGA